MRVPVFGNECCHRISSKYYRGSHTCVSGKDLPSRNYHGPAGPQKSVTSMKDVRRIFAEWPVSIPRQGLVVTSFGETIPFCNYMLCGELILLERKTPDAQGARRVIMGMDGIQAIKILDAIELARFTAMGFQGILDGR
ncbi:MAG: hypothetical protein ACK526_02510 [Planctomyces sp.]|jgi:hypothetical protein